MFMRPESLVWLSRASSRRLHAFDAFRAAGAQNDFLQPAFRRLQLFVAMRLQRLPAFVERDGIFQIDLALLQARDNAFQLLERRLEAQALDGGRLAGGSLGRNGGAPAVLDVSVNPKLRRTIIAITVRPNQLRAPAQWNYNSSAPPNKQFPC
jgi:hypothetical protein